MFVRCPFWGILLLACTIAVHFSGLLYILRYNACLLPGVMSFDVIFICPVPGVRFIEFSIRKLYSKNTETMQNLYRKYAERKNFLYRRNTETLQKQRRNNTENFPKLRICCRIMSRIVRFFVILIFGSAYKEVIRSKGCIEKDF